MQLSEKEVENFILDDLNEMYGYNLKRRGFKTVYNHISETEDPCIKAHWKNQVNLGVYGILDIIGFFRWNGKIIVELFELKAVPVQSDDFDQVLRYKTAIQRILKHDRPNLRVEILCYVVGPEIKSGHYIINHTDKLAYIEYQYDLNGIDFREHSGPWFRSDEKEMTIKKFLTNAQAIY